MASPPDKTPPASKTPPMSADGRIVANASKYARGIVLSAFQSIGGQCRFNETADEDPKWFYEKFLGKLVQPEKQVVAESDDDVEDLLRKLGDRVIDVDAAMVGDDEEPGRSDDES